MGLYRFNTIVLLLYKATPFTIQEYHSAPEILPHKRCGFWWEEPCKRGTTVLCYMFIPHFWWGEIKKFDINFICLFNEIYYYPIMHLFHLPSLNFHFDDWKKIQSPKKKKEIVRFEDRKKKKEVFKFHHS